MGYLHFMSSWLRLLLSPHHNLFLCFLLIIALVISSLTFVRTGVNCRRVLLYFPNLPSSLMAELCHLLWSAWLHLLRVSFNWRTVCGSYIVSPTFSQISYSNGFFMCVDSPLNVMNEMRCKPRWTEAHLFLISSLVRNLSFINCVMYYIRQRQWYLALTRTIYIDSCEGYVPLLIITLLGSKMAFPIQKFSVDTSR